jgi:L-threonylcarbamoyladenylate synthase
MKIINPDQLDIAIAALSAGQVIIYPTETSYGIGADATNEKAVERIFAIKQRVKEKGLPLILPSKEVASNFVVFSKSAQMLADIFWPGGLNIIAPIAPDSPIVEDCRKDGTQAVRVSSHPVASEIAARFGKPIVATSANISGAPELYRAQDIAEVFSRATEKPDIIIDAGEIPVVEPSTTVKVIGEDVKLIRQGEVRIEGRS